MMRRMPDLREIRPVALIVLVAGLGINVAALFLVNVPQADRLARSHEQVQQLIQQVDGRKGELGEMKDAMQWIEKQDRYLTVFFDEVLSGKADRMVAIQRELREIASRYGIDPSNIGYQHKPAEETSNLVRFSASFPLNGTYEALRAFIRDVEHSRNFLIIDSIDLTNSREGGVRLSLLIQVSTIFRDPGYRLFREEG